VARSIHGTLVANTPATIATIIAGWPGINILNRSQTGTIWVTLDGSTPAIAGAGSYPVLGVRYFPSSYGQGASAVVKAVSSAALDWTVEVDSGSVT
jgi:hypothetical protein